MPDLNAIFENTSTFIALTFALTLIPFVLIAVFFIIRSGRNRSQVNQAQHWPYTIGVVTGSSVEARRSTDSNGSTSTSYYPVVAYEYEVQGHRYRSSRLYVGDMIGFGSSAVAEAKIAPYLAGNRVNVYYDPNNPGFAVLERTAPSRNVFLWVALLILGIMVCSGVVMLAALGMFGSFFSDIMNSINSAIPR